MPLVLILIGLKGEAAFYLVQHDAACSFNFRDNCELGKEILVRSCTINGDFGNAGEKVQS